MQVLVARNAQPRMNATTAHPITTILAHQLTGFNDLESDSVPLASRQCPWPRSCRPEAKIDTANESARIESRPNRISPDTCRLRQVQAPIKMHWRDASGTRRRPLLHRFVASASTLTSSVNFSKNCGSNCSGVTCDKCSPLSMFQC